MTSKHQGRLYRQFDKIERRVPLAARVIAFLRRPGARMVRIPLGIVLVLGGILSFLPVLGIWMLPLGLLLLAIDLPILQPSVNWSIVRGQRKYTMWQRGRRARKTAVPPTDAD